MPHIELSSGNFYYTDSGGDGRPVVVFSHGFLMDHEMFETQVAELESDYRCIAWDEPYHGETEAEGEFTYWDTAGFLLELLDHLGVEKFFHVGMSQGGFIGLRAALTAPDRVRGLVFIDSQAGTEDPNAVPMYQGLVDQWLRGEDVEGIAEIVGSIIIGVGQDPTYWIDKWLKRPAETIPPIFKTLVERDDLHGRLSEIQCPALVIHGVEDTAIPMELAEKLAEGLHAGDVVTIEGAGHSSNMADPLKVNAAIHDFIKANS